MLKSKGQKLSFPPSILIIAYYRPFVNPTSLKLRGVKLQFAFFETVCYLKITMTKPLTQKEFDYYYAQTDPSEPKLMREIHAIRIAMVDQEPTEPKVPPSTMVKDFIQKYGIKTINYAKN